MHLTWETAPYMLQSMEMQKCSYAHSLQAASYQSWPSQYGRSPTLTSSNSWPTNHFGVCTSWQMNRCWQSAWWSSSRWHHGSHCMPICMRLWTALPNCSKTELRHWWDPHLISPKHYNQDFRKGFFLVVLQAVTNHCGHITCFGAGRLGKVNDARGFCNF